MTTLTFDEALQQVSAIAHAKLPETLHGRVEMATAMVTEGAVFPEDDGHGFAVRSSEDPDTWYRLNGHGCSCPDAAYRAAGGNCKHKIAVGLYRRAAELLREPPTPLSAMVGAAPQMETPPAGIDPRFVTQLHGKPFIQYAGLLAMAHARGLLTLKAKLISVTSELALAEAEAVFRDGRVFVEAADATPANCGAQVRAAYPRMALVRAKARALRDALNIGLCTEEELGEDGGAA